MDRKKIEKGIIQLFEEKISVHGFKLVETKLTSEHYADFEYLIGSAKFTYTLLFNKPNYLEYGNFMTISYSEISEMYKKLDPEYKEKDWDVFVVSLNKYLRPENADGFWNTGRFIETKLNQKFLEEENLVGLVNELYNFYFEPLLKNIIPFMNSLEKADILLNNVPWVNDDGTLEPKQRIYSTSLVHQVLAGTLVAKAINRDDFNDLAKRYLQYANKFEPNQVKEIDLLKLYLGAG